MSIDETPVFEIAERAGARVTLKGSQDQRVHLFVLEQDIIRVLVLPRIISAAYPVKAPRMGSPRCWTASAMSA